MPTSYDILLQQKLDQSRNIPLDAYSAGLVDVARFRAQQRFLEGQTQAQLQAQREIETMRESGAGTRQTAALGVQREIEAAREAAASARQVATIAAQKEIATQHEAGETSRAKERFAEELKQIEKAQNLHGEWMVKAAKARTQAEGEDIDRRYKAQLINHYLHEAKVERPASMKGAEHDDEYIAYAQDKSKEEQARHLFTLRTDANKYAAEANRILTEGSATRPQRINDFIIDQARGSLKPKQQAELDKLPASRKAVALNTWVAQAGPRSDLALAVENARRQALEGAVPELDAVQAARFKAAQAEAVDAKETFNDLFKRPTYAPAIPKYLDLISVGAPGGGGGGGGLDFDNVPARGGGGGVGIGGPSVRPGTPLDVYGQPTPRQAIAAATGVTGVPAAMVRPDVARATTPPPPPGAAEIYGPAGSRFGEAFRNYGVAGAALTAPYTAGEIIGSTMEAAPGFIDRYGGRAAQLLLGEKTVPTPDIFLKPEQEVVNPSGMDVYLNSLGVPKGFNVTAAGRPPTAAEIDAFRAARAARLAPAGAPEIGPARGRRTYGEVYEEQMGVPAGFSASRAAVAPGASEIGEFRNLRNARMGAIGPPASAAPVMNNYPPAEFAPAQLPPSEPMTPQELSGELRKRIKRHPKFKLYPVAPANYKLSIMSLPELQSWYESLGPE